MIRCINIKKALYKLTDEYKIYNAIVSNLCLKSTINYYGLLWNINYEGKIVIIIFLKHQKNYCIIYEEGFGNNYIEYNTCYDLEKKCLNYKKYFKLIKPVLFSDYLKNNINSLNLKVIRSHFNSHIKQSNSIILHNNNDFTKYKPLFDIIEFLKQNNIITTHNIYYCIKNSVYIIGDSNTDTYRLIEYKIDENENEDKIIFLKNTITSINNELVAYHNNLKIDVSFSYNIINLMNMLSKNKHDYIVIILNKIEYCDDLKYLLTN